MKIIFMSSVMIRNITILNIHLVNGRWVQTIIHFVHEQPNSILNCQLAECLIVKIVVLCEPDAPKKLLI